MVRFIFYSQKELRFEPSKHSLLYSKKIYIYIFYILDGAETKEHNDKLSGATAGDRVLSHVDNARETCQWKIILIPSST